MSVLSPIERVCRNVRKIVSQDRVRYVDSKYDLDLTYITNNVIAMGMPATGLESTWRNHIDDVANMLNEYHGDQFLIWNLSERAYNYEKFQNQILEFGFPDHHNPPLDLLFEIVLSMERWLNACQGNVAVVHCKGGKGRTGTVIACYLNYCGMFDTPIEALEFFGAKRSIIDKGVTQPSQRRYVGYFGQILSSRTVPETKRQVLSKVVVNTIPILSRSKMGCRPCLQIFSMGKTGKKLLYSCKSENWYKHDEDSVIIWKPNCPIKGDILLKVTHQDSNIFKKMFRFSFHTAFTERYVTLNVNELDDIPVKKKVDDPKKIPYYPPQFHVRILFDDDTESVDEEEESDLVHKHHVYSKMFEHSQRSASHWKDAFPKFQPVQPRSSLNSAVESGRALGLARGEPTFGSRNSTLLLSEGNWCVSDEPEAQVEEEDEAAESEDSSELESDDSDDEEDGTKTPIVSRVKYWEQFLEKSEHIRKHTSSTALFEPHTNPDPEEQSLSEDTQDVGATEVEVSDIFVASAAAQPHLSPVRDTETSPVDNGDDDPTNPELPVNEVDQGSDRLESPDQEESAQEEVVIERASKPLKWSCSNIKKKKTTEIASADDVRRHSVEASLMGKARTGSFPAESAPLKFVKAKTQKKTQSRIVLGKPHN